MYRRLGYENQYTMQCGSGLPLFNSIFLFLNSMIVIYLIKKSLVMTLSVAVVVMLSNAAENRSTFLSSILNLLPLIFSAIFSLLHFLTLIQLQHSVKLASEAKHFNLAILCQTAPPTSVRSNPWPFTSWG